MKFHGVKPICSSHFTLAVVLNGNLMRTIDSSPTMVMCDFEVLATLYQLNKTTTFVLLCSLIWCLLSQHLIRCKCKKEIAFAVFNFKNNQILPTSVQTLFTDRTKKTQHAFRMDINTFQSPSKRKLLSLWNFWARKSRLKPANFHFILQMCSSKG